MIKILINLAKDHRGRPLMVFGSINIRVHMSCQLIYGLAKSILSIEQQLLPTWWAFQFRFHIGFLKCFHVPFIQDLCLCIGFTKVLIFTCQLFQTCSMSTLESASCPHVQDRVLQEANILNIERLVKKLKSISASDAATE